MSKNTVISIVVILVTVIAGGYLLFSKKDSFLGKNKTLITNLSSVQIKFSEKNFKYDFSPLPADTVEVLALFGKDETWNGNHEIDEIIKWEGESSMMLTSKNNSKEDVYTNRKINLDKYQIIKLVMNVSSDPTDVENFRIYFSNKDKTSYFFYPVRNLAKGWNFITIEKMKFSAFNAKGESLPKTTIKNQPTGAGVASGWGWGSVERIGFEFSSRANSTAVVNIDDLRTLENEDFRDDFLVSNPNFLDLTKNSNKIVLQAKNIGASTALIKKLSGLSDFTFKAKVMPQTINARSGLFVRGDYKTNFGYYFLIDGLNGSRWQILKYGLVDEKAAQTILKNGIINNFIVERDIPLYLKVEAKDRKMNFSLSTDDKSYTLLGQVNDSEFKEGGAGIAVYDGGMSLFDEFSLTQ